MDTAGVTGADLGRIAEAARRRLWNPFDMSVMAVAAMPLSSAAAACAVLWPPFGYVAAVAAVVLYPRVHRGVRRELGSTGSTGVGRVIVGGVSLLLSIPVAQVFFRGDLTAMAAPFVAATTAGEPDMARTVPEAIYGSAPGWPSYAPCQVIQDWTGTSAAGFCYSGFGYLRLWQMPVALPMLASITLLYIAIPLVVIWFTPSRGRPRFSELLSR